MFLNSKIQGEGQPLLLMHGLFGHLSNLNQLAKAFINSHKVIQIDLPNHGLSSRLEIFDYALLADSIALFLKDQGIENIDIIGHSFGGKIAMALALKYPNLINRLLVLDIAPISYEKDRHQRIFTALKATIKAKAKNRKEADQILSLYIQDASVRQFLLTSFSKDENNKMNWRFAVELLEQNYPAIANWTLKGQFLPKTLFIKGDQSDYIQKTHWPLILQFFPNAKIHLISHAGHWLHVEKPTSVIRTIRRFLER